MENAVKRTTDRSSEFTKRVNMAKSPKCDTNGIVLSSGNCRFGIIETAASFDTLRQSGELVDQVCDLCVLCAIWRYGG